MLSKEETFKMVKAIYKRYKTSAKKRNHYFALSVEDFGDLILQNCGYCGAEPSNEYKSGSKSLRYNGIDRIDSNRGYVDGNVIPSCRFCNTLKGAMGWRDWLDFINCVVVLHGGDKPYPNVTSIRRPSKSFYKGR